MSAEDEGRFYQTPLSEYLHSNAAGSVRAWAVPDRALLPLERRGHLPHSAETARILLKCHEATTDGQRLLVVEPIIGPANEPDPAKFPDLKNMLVKLGGRERASEDLERL